jgi:hypothetical protein
MGKFFHWDWFEQCKYLSALSGIFAAGTVTGIVVAKYRPEKWLAGVIISVCCLGMVFVIGTFVNYIRTLNPDKKK